MDERPAPGRRARPGGCRSGRSSARAPATRAATPTSASGPAPTRRRPGCSAGWTRRPSAALLPEADGLEVEVHPLPNLRAVNVVVRRAARRGRRRPAPASTRRPRGSASTCGRGWSTCPSRCSVTRRPAPPRRSLAVATSTCPARRAPARSRRPRDRPPAPRWKPAPPGQRRDGAGLGRRRRRRRARPGPRRPARRREAGRPHRAARARAAPPLQALRRRADRRLAGGGPRAGRRPRRARPRHGRPDHLHLARPGRLHPRTTEPFLPMVLRSRARRRAGRRRGRRRRGAADRRHRHGVRRGGRRRHPRHPRRAGAGARRRRGRRLRQPGRRARRASSATRSTSGMEAELPTPPGSDWRGRVLLDWGPVPGSYGWVFPKGDTLTVGVIGAREQGEAVRAYYRAFVASLGLDRVDGAPRRRPPDPGAGAGLAAGARAGAGRRRRRRAARAVDARGHLLRAALRRAGRGRGSRRRDAATPPPWRPSWGRRWPRPAGAGGLHPPPAGRARGDAVAARHVGAVRAAGGRRRRRCRSSSSGGRSAAWSACSAADPRPSRADQELSHAGHAQPPCRKSMIGRGAAGGAANSARTAAPCSSSSGAAGRRGRVRPGRQLDRVARHRQAAGVDDHPPHRRLLAADRLGDRADRPARHAGQLEHGRASARPGAVRQQPPPARP